MTLKGLAALAGVSVSTVSRVLNKNDASAAGQETRARIWALARQHGYLPNTAAQSLVAGGGEAADRGSSIVCVFARAAGDGANDPFFSSIFRAAEHECRARGCRVSGVFAARELAHGAAAVKALRPDGALVLGRCARGLFDVLQESCRHVAYTGLNRIPARCDQIVCDGYGAARAAVAHLYALGHRRIGYLGEMHSEERWRGYFDALRELTLPFSRALALDAELSQRGGYERGKELLCLRDPPTGVFCANDITALGLLRAAREQGVRVPEQLSVVSIDNIEEGSRVTPTLTSIDIPKEELGRIAAKILLDRIGGGHRLPLNVEIPFTLLRRASTALVG